VTNEQRLTSRPMGRRGFLKTTGGIAVFGGAFLLVGCGDDDDDPTPTTAPTKGAAGTNESLYSRLGGGMAVKAVVDDFLVNVGGDTRINKFFANTDLNRLNMLLVEQIGAATGGPEKYTGRDMKAMHANLKITMADFNALVEAS
jgi:hemoglobin